ncbi:DUF2861 family protein [Parasalinivibrio latis]|uniref:DUF2861 family protein n=1 Tax=Parasalinivibrio latis TaxID=2952610 RepID=UPI0030DFC86C
MRRRLLAAGLLTTLTAFPSSADWFNKADSLTFAHQKLLLGDTAGSFSAMVEAWQQNLNKEERDNLIGLLGLALDEDCGRSLSQQPLPAWLDELSLRRERVQLASRVEYRFYIRGTANDAINELRFTRWPGESVVNLSLSGRTGPFEMQLDDLNAPVSEGLYKLEISSSNGETWNSWILLQPPKPHQRLSWVDASTWRVAKPTQLNKVCQKPVQTVGVFPMPKSDQAPVWSDERASNLPVSLPQLDVTPGQYWLDVAFIEQRWQGMILVENVQRLGRVVTLPDINYMDITTPK